jgi:hypothetical protein
VEGTFSQGFWTGFLAAGVVGFLAQRMYLAVKRVGSPRQPQRVSQSTSKTPFQVMGDAMKAVFLFLIYGGLLAIAFAVIYYVLTGESVL